MTEDNADAELGMADELNRQGRLDEAAEHYQRAVQRAVDSAPHNNYGAFLAKQGQLDKAIVQFQAALALEPRSTRRCSTWARPWPGKAGLTKLPIDSTRC